MSVRALGNAFATQLHRAALKPRGFKKAGHSFSCERLDYIEIVEIQGSSWNSGSEPWRFYISVAVRFTDLPTSSRLKNANLHARGRIEGLVADAPSAFDLDSENLQALVSRIAGYIEHAGRALPPFLPIIRERAIAGLVSPIPLPATWQGVASRG